MSKYLKLAKHCKLVEGVTGNSICIIGVCTHCLFTVVKNYSQAGACKFAKNK